MPVERFRRNPVIAAHEVVTHGAWLEARIDLLSKEKEFTRLRDELSERRRALPWEEVEKRYVFDAEGDRRRWPTCSTGAAS
jgi:predicted dithiol-disulfide oxidoreductase (DUF899 family)